MRAREKWWVICGSNFGIRDCGADVLYRFQGGSDGVGPAGTLIFDDRGELYGVAAYGGAYDRETVFKLTPGSGGKWAKSVLYTFQGSQHSDGATPFAGLVADEKGNLFGTTYFCAGGIVSGAPKLVQHRGYSDSSVS